MRDRLASDPNVTAFSVETPPDVAPRPGASPGLRVALDRPSEIDTLAREIRTVHEPEEWAPGTLRFFYVDLSSKFRYCLETDTDPTPAERLRLLSLSLPEQAIAHDDVTELELNAEPAGDSPGDDLEAVTDALGQTDPDV